MTRLRCMRLGTGQSGATVVNCILRDGSPRPQADMSARNSAAYSWLSSPRHAARITRRNASAVHSQHFCPAHPRPPPFRAHKNRTDHESPTDRRTVACTFWRLDVFSGALKYFNERVLGYTDLMRARINREMGSFAR